MATKLEDVLKNIEAQKQLNDLMDDELERKKANLLLEKQTLNLIIKTGQLSEEERKRYKEIEKQLKGINKQVERENNLYKSTLDFVTNISGITPKKEGFMGGILSGDISRNLGSIGRALKENYSFASIFSSALKKVQESFIALFIQQEAALSMFKKTTASYKEYDDTIKDLGVSHLDFGLSVQDMTETMIGLRDNFREFVHLTPNVQKEVVALSSQIKEFGISASVSGKNFDIMTRLMGYSADKSMVSQKNLVGLAKALGETPEKIANSFAQSMPKLVAFGSKAEEQFKKLSGVAKSTGIAMERLLDIVESFETYSGSAERVSRLNAILGGSFLDMNEMMKFALEDPYKALEKLREGLDKAGLSWNNMSAAQKKAISSSMNISIDELGRIMNSSMAEYKSQTEEARMSQEEFNKMLKDAMPLWDKFKSTMLSIGIMALKVLSPIVDILKDILDWVNKLGVQTKGMSTFLAFVGIPAVILAFLKLGGVVKWLVTAPFSMLGKGLGTLGGTRAGTGLTGMAGNISNAGKAAGASASSLLAFGAAIAMIGAAIYTATSGIANLIESFKGLSDTGAILATTVVTGMLTLLGVLVVMAPVSKIASLGLLAVGTAILMIGAGIKLATSGMSGLTASFSSLASNFSFLGASSILATASAITVFAASLTSISSESVNSMKELANSFEKISNSMNTVPSTKNFTMKSTTTATAQTTTNQSAANNTNGERTIIIQLGDRVLKKFVIDVLKEQMDVRTAY